mmetsp:Transcript_46412/g.53481  ORF Transcript_46412/g.53481 Transcript_46412/m.53481 type:complete len:242 (-) Transcript_46412:298-1023(-)
MLHLQTVPTQILLRILIFGGIITAINTGQTKLQELPQDYQLFNFAPSNTRADDFFNYQVLGTSSIYVPSINSIIFFGGFSTQKFEEYASVASGFLDDIWILQLDSNSITPIRALGIPPPGRAFHGAMYDEKGNQMLVSGGVTEASSWRLRKGIADCGRGYGDSSCIVVNYDVGLSFARSQGVHEIWSLDLKEFRWTLVQKRYDGSDDDDDGSSDNPIAGSHLSCGLPTLVAIVSCIILHFV